MQTQTDCRDHVCQTIKSCIEAIASCNQNQEQWAKNSVADLAVILSDIQASKQN